MRTFVVILVIICFTTVQMKAQKGYDPSFKASRSENLLQDKNFYLFTAIQNEKAVKQLLMTNSVLKAFKESQDKLLAGSLQQHKENPALLVKTYLLSQKEISQIGDELKNLVQRSAVLQHFIRTNLRPSGAYEAYKELSDADYLEASWNLCAAGINHNLTVYGLGEAPQYATIDSISYDVSSSYYKGALWMWSDRFVKQENDKPALFFENSLNYALALLYMNHRDEASRYEPLILKENAKAAAHVKHTDFDAYPYASILVLGNGPENYRDRLSAVGKLNLQLGVLKYRQKQAPFIIVSGGHAHPFRADYAEAIEMKKELINYYKIPEEHIIIEPHARHTTTNLRNAARLMIAYAMPLKQKSLVIANNLHSAYTGDQRFIERCQEELGYAPARILNRIDATTLEFLPQLEALQQNPMEPLDP
ncbi:YdcF family protein [Leeuwenhoekiella polynyae]|uniref:Putative SAM-binding protein YcdF (DUF218 family) n=1 Tax=Leeuwenhoekiella polynyae TaxID=1550906 RepID=A0A4V1KRT9_9FLAO|nr:YdcF family protein [Leeuwenhoekiella polynyae]RXG26074.1 putative SAM-binding protein YcdF (DUF218 family) [Leeuwenhoekiella polynyae]